MFLNFLVLVFQHTEFERLRSFVTLKMVLSVVPRNSEIRRKKETGFGKNGEEGFRGSNFKLHLQVALGEEETRKRDMDSENNGEKGFGL